MQVGREIFISCLPNQGYFKKFYSNLIIKKNIVLAFYNVFIESKFSSQTI